MSSRATVGSPQDELERHDPQRLSELARELDVHADELVARVEEREGQPVRDERDAQGAARPDAIDRRSRLEVGRRHVRAHDGRNRTARQVHAQKELVLAISGVDGRGEQQARPEDGNDYRDHHHRHRAAEACRVQAQEARHRRRPDQGHCEQAHRRYERVELPGEDRRRDVELKVVVRHADEVHQERQRDLRLGEVGEQACSKQARIAREAERIAAATPVGHEEQVSSRPAFGKVNAIGTRTQRSIRRRASRPWRSIRRSRAPPASGAR
jgi:hypothetical protein